MTSAYPLQWPDGWQRTPAVKRLTSSLFKTTFLKARAGLYAELQRFGATDVVISSWLPLRLDGMPRSDAARLRIEDPGVAVYFRLRGKQMVMARDAYATVHDNLRSIGLAVEFLRGVERHGGAAMTERAFEGFAAIAPPRTWRIVLGFQNASYVPRDMIEQRYRELAKARHPDVGGSDSLMAELNAARDQALREVAA